MTGSSSDIEDGTSLKKGRSMGRKNRNEGFGMILIGMALLLFVLFLMIIPVLPFQVTVIEQSLLYLFAFLLLMGGLALVIKW